jgi:hypothetical protein
MGEPVTTGMMIGAALGGGTSALRGKNPIEGALMGGLTGGIGGGISGGAMGGSSSPFSLGSILNGIGTNAAAGGDPAKGLAMNAAALAGSGGGFNPLSGGGYGSIGTAGQAAGSAGSGIGNIFGQGGTLSQIGQGLSLYNQANQAFGGNEQPIPMAPAGQIQRGQVQPMDYMSLLNPQGQSVMRPQPISLL